MSNQLAFQSQQRCMLDDLCQNNPQIIQYENHLVIAHDNEFVIIDPLNGNCCNIPEQLPERISALSNAVYAGKQVLVVACQSQIYLFSFNLQQITCDGVNLTVFRHQLETTIAVNIVGTEEINYMTFQNCGPYGVILTDENHAYVISTHSRKIIFEVCGLCPANEELNNIFCSEGECTCGALVDKFTDILDEIDEQKNGKKKNALMLNAKDMQDKFEYCDHCQKSFIKNCQLLNSKTMHVYGPHAVLPAEQLQITRICQGSKGTCAVRNDFHHICLINQAKDMFQFCIYGSHPELVIYSVPVWLLNALDSINETAIQLNCFPIIRLCGQYENGLIFENFGEADEQNYFWLKKQRNWSRPFSFSGDLNIYSDVQRVIWLNNKLIINSWEGGVFEVELNIPVPNLYLSGMEHIFPAEFKDQISQCLGKQLTLPKNCTICGYDKELSRLWQEIFTSVNVDLKITNIVDTVPSYFYILPRHGQNVATIEETVPKKVDLCFAEESTGLAVYNDCIICQDASMKVWLLESGSKKKKVLVQSAKNVYFEFITLNNNETEYIIGVSQKYLQIWKMK